MEEYHIYLGSDHRGFQKKEDLFELIKDCHENVSVEDLGPFEYNAEDDYNDAAIKVAKAVLGDGKNTDQEHNFGILICGSAHGVCMQANRFKGIRAVNASTVESVRHARTNDYANVLCLSGDYLDVDTMEKLVKTFCHARPDPSEKYQRRAKRLDEEA